MNQLFLTIIIFSSITTWGQGTLTGSILDENKKALTGAHIVLKETAAGTFADELGNYRLKNIDSGEYTVTVSFVGYETSSQRILITDGKTQELQVRLKPGDIQLGDLVLSASAQQPINSLSPVDIQLRPVNNSQDILRMVPGLFISQHAGGGKAEQIFLRGFDIDHGTDLNLEVDGLPVNMVSHAHGQGYSDLHFVIPEMINYVDFDKGPYYAEKGDFTTAGFVDFQTKNVLEDNFIKLEGGQFGTLRSVAGLNLFSRKHEKTTGYIGAEFFRTDGFVETPQDFVRTNIMSKISTRLNNNSKLTVGASFFSSTWDASGQIPTRAVNSGQITRFGAVDDTERGSTSRANLFVKYFNPFPNGAYLSHQGYAVRYDFNLFSNFTFFLNDPVNGDQIQQKESRMIYGYKSRYNTRGRLWGRDLSTDMGVGFRLDDVDDVSLSRTSKRNFLNYVQRGDVSEANINAYVSGTLSVSQKWSLNAAFRFDYFSFRYENMLASERNNVDKAIVSPKIKINYQLNPSTHFFLKTGLGFHSNDARVAAEQTGREILPRAYGIDLGLNTKVTERLFLHTAIWALDLDQEFVYVGDGGIVEPSGETKRFGVDISIRYEIMPGLFLDGDVNWTNPKAKSQAEGKDYIPLAPIISSIGGITYEMKNGINGSLRYRYIGDRAANEDYSVVAKGYFIADAEVNYTKRSFEIGLSAENLSNIDWNEAQFDTESRLIGESDPVSEIHFTPGTPMFIKMQVTFYF